MNMQRLCPLSSFSAFTKGRKNIAGLRVCISAFSLSSVQPVAAAPTISAWSRHSGWQARIRNSPRENKHHLHSAGRGHAKFAIITWGVGRKLLGPCLTEPPSHDRSDKLRSCYVAADHGARVLCMFTCRRSLFVHFQTGRRQLSCQIE
jgi:hypothetical protein